MNCTIESYGNREVWLLARKGGLGGSDSPCVLGMGFDFEYQTVGWQWWFNCNSLELADLAKALRAAADAVEGKA